MSFDGHVLCQRILIAPCALTTLGAATAAVVASAAPLRNLRRVAAADEVALGIYSLPGSDLRDDMVRLLRLTRPNSSYSGKAGCMGAVCTGCFRRAQVLELSRPTPRGSVRAEPAERCLTRPV